MNYNALSAVLDALVANKGHCLDNQPEQLAVAVAVVEHLRTAGIIESDTDFI